MIGVIEFNSETKRKGGDAVFSEIWVATTENIGQIGGCLTLLLSFRNGDWDEEAALGNHAKNKVGFLKFQNVAVAKERVWFVFFV